MVLINTIEILHFLIKYHPHQSVYFNVLAGDVAKNFKRDYYGVSYKKALTLLLEQEKEDTLKIYSEDFIGKINSMNFRKEEAGRLKFVKRIEEADYFSTLFNFRTTSDLHNYRNRNYPYCSPEVTSISVRNNSAIKILKLYNLVENKEKN